MELLRLAQSKDWEDVNRLCRQVVALHAAWNPGYDPIEDHPYPMDFFLETIQKKQMYVAVSDNEIVGYIRFYTWESRAKRQFLSIEDIGVDEARRNQGIGQKMMADLRELARDSGCSDLQLYVDVHNENAMAFYKKCGFHVYNTGMRMKL